MGTAIQAATLAEAQAARRAAESGGGATIKSIQRGVMTIHGTSTATATITAVDPAKTEVRFLGWRIARDDNTMSPYLELQDATTLRGVRDAGYDNVWLSYEVTEWE